MPRPIVVAPDSFKGTFAAPIVAEAIASGIEQQGVPALRLPIADGGEGTMDALVSVLGGEVHEAIAGDPLGRPRTARFAMLPDGRTAIVEMAEASGLALVAEHERDARAASTRGTGELIVAAVALGAEHVIVTVGGSATTDGGAGALDALDDAGVAPRLTVVCDVAVPFEDAPRIFGPQKGADPETVAELEARLDELARRAPRDPRGVPMTGGAGGLSGGLWAFREAELVPGAAYVLDALRFDDAARDAVLVISGEGALDEQTFTGKAVGEVAARCARLGVPCHAVVGRSRLSDARARELGVAAVHEASTLDDLRAAGARLARLSERVGAKG
ncbi:MAG: glycerate 2-kinase [Solirubrobacteraceae bacterium]|jgi:glycerate kinase|nr:glycerate 2-kinase [Solirubrobacteraceae bacterium]